MVYSTEKYRRRIIDKKINDYLSIFGAISIEGPKWCGKTWAGKNIAKSIYELDDEKIRDIALIDPHLILKGETPSLIDEWKIVPSLWDAIRRECDIDEKRGKYILTCSTSLLEDENKKIYHSGAGRIGKIKMHTMSLLESGDSTGKASITKMYEGSQANILNTNDVDIKNLAKLIIRGGFPGNIDVDKYDILLNEYIESILDKDIYDGKKRDRRKMLLLLRSLARNESTIASIATIKKDINANDANGIESEKTISDYLDALDRLYLLNNQEAYTVNYRSRERIGKSVKRHLADPSLSACLLKLTEEKLINDIKTFGFLYEAMIERDLMIYIESLGGKLYHFRDNVTGLEIDSIIEFKDGEYGAIEIKLGYNEIEAAKDSLLKFKSKVEKEPRFMCIVVGMCKGIVQDKETGIWIVPGTALGV